MSNLAQLEQYIAQATVAKDVESISIFEKERDRILLEETDWIPAVIKRARDVGDFETVDFLQGRLDAAPKAPPINTPFSPSGTFDTPSTTPDATYETSFAPEEDSNWFAEVGENLLGGSATGFKGFFETSALGVATLLEEEAELEARKVIQSVGDSLSTDFGDPDDTSYKIGQGLGSIGAMIGTAYAAAAAAPAALGTA